MKRMTARAYARREKISLFQVIKKIQKGELRGEQIEENGLKIQYVLLEEDSDESLVSEIPPSKNSKEEADPGSLQSLPAELHALKEEVARLRKIIEACCPKADQREGL